MGNKKNRPKYNKQGKEQKKSQVLSNLSLLHLQLMHFLFVNQLYICVKKLWGIDSFT